MEEHDSPYDHPMGEGFESDVRKPTAIRGNRLFSRMKKKGIGAEINLGEHGTHDIDNVRLRDALKEGHLLVYIRQESSEHPVIASTVALGIVAAGIVALKHRKK